MKKMIFFYVIAFGLMLNSSYAYAQEPQTIKENNNPFIDGYVRIGNQVPQKGRKLCEGVYWLAKYRTREKPVDAEFPFNDLLIDGLGFHVDGSRCDILEQDGTRLFTIYASQHSDQDYLIASMLYGHAVNPVLRSMFDEGSITKGKNEFAIVTEMGGFFNSMAETDEEMRKGTKPSRSLWFYSYYEYGLFSSQNTFSLPPERMKELLKKWIDTQRGALKADNNPKEVARRRELYLKRCREATEKREYHTPQKAENEWNKESRKNDVIRIRWYPDSDGRNMAELLKIPVPKIHNTIPNINSGTACGSVSSLFGKKGYRPEEAEGGNDALRATFNNGKNRIHYLIYHAFNRRDAIYAMCAWPCYDGRLNVRRKINQDAAQAEDMANKLVKTEKLVGDLALYEWPRLDGNGALPPGRVKSAVWFVRGNTAVAIVSEDPYVDVLPYASAVDKELQKKAGAAAGTARKKE